MKVVSWNEAGLKLTDGRRILPAGMKRLPSNSFIMKVATKHGVEISVDGKVYGLIELQHWCGNDPIRYDLRKIEISRLLSYYREGESTLKPHSFAESSFEKAGGGSLLGWNVSDYVRWKMCFDPKFADLYSAMR